MKLWLEVNKITKKKKWNNEKCNGCGHRFSCFSGNEVIIDPDSFLEEGNHWVAVFSVPYCLRVGLFKQLPDSWFMSNFKYGKVIEVDDEISQVSQATITIKPPTIRIEGRLY